ncbi:MAG: DUF262 domain-containing protein [Bacteroidales bacterium]|nr:DUF262 domain-containing protein [Bacteroidales bacterium]
MNNINLAAKFVGEIKGEFYVPAYQRGYRWKEEIEMLLNDIDEIVDRQNYCLQPVVVKSFGKEKYELIDGQQRLTTIYLILRYIRCFLPKNPIKFTIEYETRKSRQFLESIDFDKFNHTELIKQAKDDKDIDEYFFIEAMKIIIDWFGKHSDGSQTAIDISTKLNKQIRVIWYEVGTDESSVSLFTRLNIGRIPLTNAELIKALFLSRNNSIDEGKQLEIATAWDIIEKELHYDSFWGFITNERAELYPTRIELIFDLIAEKIKGEKDKFFTFFHFVDKMKNNNKADIWTDIQRYFQRLKEWYEYEGENKNFELYHKIGYLVASGSKGLQELIKNSDGITKKEFRNSLDNNIAESIKVKKDYCELSYESDSRDIQKLLLLFNVETVMQQGGIVRFPFYKYKHENWSLEHIHAQHPEGLNKKEQWIEWIELHKTSLLNRDKEQYKALIEEMSSAKDDITAEKFNDLSEKVIQILSEKGSEEINLGYIHSLSNMALLNRRDNSVLNNSAFDVKRNKILELDKAGDYIPECTRRVFLKYYTQSQSNQLYFWGEDDRKAYIEAINKVLEKYLKRR